MRKIAIAICLGACALASAQSAPPRPIRIQVRHADPWAVKALLEGSSIPYPELSTLMAFGGMLPVGPAVNGLLKGGHFMVNAGDNSLWFIYDK